MDPLLVLHRAPLGTAWNAAFFPRAAAIFGARQQFPRAPSARQAPAPPGTSLHEKCCVNATWSAFLPRILLGFPHLSRNKAFPKILLVGMLPFPHPFSPARRPLFGLALRQVHVWLQLEGVSQCKCRSRRHPWVLACGHWGGDPTESLQYLQLCDVPSWPAPPSPPCSQGIPGTCSNGLGVLRACKCPPPALASQCRFKGHGCLETGGNLWLRCDSGQIRGDRGPPPRSASRRSHGRSAPPETPWGMQNGP